MTIYLILKYLFTGVENDIRNEFLSGNWNESERKILYLNTKTQWRWIWRTNFATVSSCPPKPLRCIKYLVTSIGITGSYSSTCLRNLSVNELSLVWNIVHKNSIYYNLSRQRLMSEQCRRNVCSLTALSCGINLRARIKIWVIWTVG